MRSKHARIVVDLRTGEDVVHVPDLIAVLSAANWKTDIALKEYEGEALKLAKKAAKEGCSLVISYGGDGTLNDVVNGVMYAGGESLVGDIPGGTFNEWAGTIDVPEDPVKAALTLVNSEARKVDLGHIEVQGLTFPGSAGIDLQTSRQVQKKPKRSTKTRQYFLLHVGMGIDAAIMAHISKPLKYHFGRLAFDLAAIKELPELHPFPVEVQVMSEHGDAAIDWQGEAWQVIVSKTRSYAGRVDVAPDAYLDDGVLNMCIITAGNPIRSLEQAVSLLVQHEPDDTTAKYFRGAHLSIRVPASIGMQVDGSVMKLEDYLRKEERDALKQTNDAGQVMVNYRFDAVPAALQMAISRTYNGALFKTASHAGHSEFLSSEQRGEQIATIQHNGKNAGGVQNEYQQRIDALQKQGLKVTVVGVVPHPDKTGTYIIAGRYKKQDTDETGIVAIRVNDHTLVLRQESEQVPPATVERLQEGEEIVVEGDRSKRGVIRARGVSLAK